MEGFTPTILAKLRILHLGTWNNEKDWILYKGANNFKKFHLINKYEDSDWKTFAKFNKMTGELLIDSHDSVFIKKLYLSLKYLKITKNKDHKHK